MKKKGRGGPYIVTERERVALVLEKGKLALTL
jgi:hypothetical protein